MPVEAAILVWTRTSAEGLQYAFLPAFVTLLGFLALLFALLSLAMESKKRATVGDPNSKREESQKADSESGDEEDLQFLENLSPDLQHGYRILKELMGDQNTIWPFLDPVDVEGLNLTNYHAIVKRPMCFSQSE